MVTEIRIYLEGGGDKSHTKTAIREGFTKFLQPQQAAARQLRFRVIPCGSRNDAFANFTKALRDHPEAALILLVDSEAPVMGGRWDHLQKQDGWRPGKLSDNVCHFMVQSIEAWLVADPETLGAYYGQGFNQNALPKRKDVEAIPKDQLLQRLNRATAKTQKGSYKKIHHCADLLARLNRDRIRQRAKHCDLLFGTLESLIQQS
jgi:hypothetical protein